MVLDRSGGFDRLGWVLVEAVVEDRLDGAVAVGADGQRAARGGLQACIAVALRQTQDPQQERKACWGWRREPSTVVISAPVLGPIFSAQRVKRSGVHRPIRRCFSGMCSSAVV